MANSTPGRILAIDYGTKRCGLAWTDPLRIAISDLPTTETAHVLEEIAQRVQAGVTTLVLGYPTTPDGNPTDATAAVEAFARRLQLRFPNIPVVWQDEYRSTQRARALLVQSGIRKGKRRQKANVDAASAVILLTDFLAHEP